MKNYLQGTLDRTSFSILIVALTGLKMQLDPIMNQLVDISRFHSYGLAPLWPFEEPLVMPHFVVSLLILSFAFICTVRRIRSIGWPVWLALLLLVPQLNYLFCLILCLTPDQSGDPRVSLSSRFLPKTKIEAAMLSVFLTLGLVGGLGLTLIYLYGEYSWTVFMFVPFLGGLTAVLLYTAVFPADLSECITLSIASCAGMGLAMLTFALEGLICITMAAIPAVPLAIVGGVLGYYLRENRHGFQSGGLSVLLFLPVSIGLDHARTAPLTSVVTEVHMAAPIQEVWDTVIAFPQIPEPEEWLFRSGIAYPTHAEIEGHGVGALRLCHFSTGAFVEPIHTWDEPFHLAFNVSKQPHPMQELSPYGEIHPPHLEGYLRSERGEFRLIPLEDGSTLVRGTTWYRQQLGPDYYWRLWSDWIISRIHHRVLGHIKSTVEASNA